MKAMNLVGTGAPPDRTADQWHTIASIFRQAFADRFTYLADPDQVEVPLQALHSDDYARRTVENIGDAATSVPEYMKDGSTTHLSVIDGDGNAVSLTQTLLSLFGSFITVPGTGILMNNGMMWFDPEPGRPNSIGGGKRPLSNMAPVLIEKDGTIVASLGASGGRKIMNCNAQLVMNIVDGGMSAQDAIDVPRIDCSTSTVVASNRISADVLEELRGKGYKVASRHEALLTSDFSSPVAVRRDADGMLDGGADPWYFAATVVGVEGS
jgi:gamma-glutamyltranspeptidase/glutathione hydrolase